jgi:hypothetical protein
MPAAELLQTLERETFEAIERVASLRHAVSKATTACVKRYEHG